MKNENNKIEYHSAKQKIIYVMRINDIAHDKMLKVGDASNNLVDFSFGDENTEEMNGEARKRIDDYTKTAGIKYDLLFTTLAVDNIGNAFRDYDVHRVLINSGIKKEHIEGANEWFKTDLNTVKNAIKAVKDGRVVLSGFEISNDKTPISFREEQEEAINIAIDRFSKKDVKAVLWNAKMRFGKTLSALEVIRRKKYVKSIIITHRPVVDDGWFEDFNKIFNTYDNYLYGSKNKGIDINDLIKENEKSQKSFVYFASIQDLRGSKEVGGKFDKNDALYGVDWNLVIIDEAHEGTTTRLGENVIEKFNKKNTKFLYLSGTPFNIQDKFEEDNVYTWDYTMEQKAKEEWSKLHPLESNPYEDLPKINIYTYNLDDDIKNYFDISDKAFNFKEFFRVYTGDIEKDRQEIPKDSAIGEFIHKEDVIKFLDLLTKSDTDSNYPFSINYYRDNFNHTLWIVPGIKEAKALSKLLKEHKVFNTFNIVNVAGEGDEDEKKEDALDKVKDAIKKYDYTITLSCGKLTTGTTIKEWTACLYLAGSYLTSASSYLQTIFRVQTPSKANGKIKENCYVFDFAPDRVLRILAEASQMTIKQSNDNEKRYILNLLINYLPVISMNGSSTKKYDVDHLLRELKSAYAERVANNGFDDSKLYNDNLLKLNDLEIEKFNDLKEIIGKQTSDKPKNKITINDQGLDNVAIESIEKFSKDAKKNKRELTKEEKERLEKYLNAKKQRDIAISILRGISVRIPLLIYGMDKGFDEEISIDNFTDMIDDESFEEFMPKDVTKEKFNEFKKYYDKDVFVEAGKLIRLKLKKCDNLPVLERIIEISSIFKTFRNPDKETVLTPWKTVNMHLSDTLGGYYLYREIDDGKDFIPKLIDNGEVTKDTLLNKNAHILEINSKTGLYPLYIAYSIFRAKLDAISQKNVAKEKIDDLWYKTIEDNIYVLCKTKMAKTITLRTLCGYNMKKNGNNYIIAGGYKPNIHYFEDYVNQVKNKQDKLVDKILSKKFWGKEGSDEMEFDAVVGNPPYQEKNHFQVYPFFYLLSRKLAKYVSLIFPIGWQEPKSKNNLQYMNTDDVKKDCHIIKIDNRHNVFPEVQGAEWVNVILWNEKYDNKLNGKQLVYTDGEKPQKIELLTETSQIAKPKEIVSLSEIVINTNGFVSISNQVSSRKPFGLDTNVFEEKPYDFKINGTKNDTNLLVYGAHNEIRYISVKYNKLTNKDKIHMYKVFVPYAWGNMDEKKYLGGAFADIIIGAPNEIVNETYLVAGYYKNKDKAKKMSKYLMCKFTRALLYMNKTSRHSTTSWNSIPTQDFSEEWWDSNDIDEINNNLYKKYSVPIEIQKFVDENFQSKDISNIVNY